ncbi:S8 family serine peptidase [Sphingomonas sp. KR1UV-12]|uniref:S8 family serine peptidase n=1 Tax=Sphingomonas aurea TaxID=3063994 RepID=A0ABT9ELF7_9SPHN|nr:S8 family serine peptidase [Sphingomonas sp. KR1UV-12]MDP1027769.1 S8 family serine peptidase [Sphingomonas sp. KR1UV-12]
MSVRIPVVGPVQAVSSEWQPPAPTPVALLLKVRRSPDGGAPPGIGSLTMGAEPLMSVEADPVGAGVAPAPRATWYRLDASEHPWDQAHAVMRMGFAAGSGDVLAAEPEFEQQWMAGPAGARCIAEPQDPTGGRPVGPHPRWHLDDAFSGLASARASVPAASQSKVLVAHLDTGYDPAHDYRPANIAPGERSFVKGEGRPDSAEDVTGGGGAFRNRGHGTGTAGILAGPDIGGAPDVSYLPIRIADGVVRFRTGTMAQGFDYAVQRGARVLSMSMGGLASAMLADAVNKAYAAGLVMVSAAGNNFAGLPVRSIVYPARMRRVVAACGVMANMQPYSGLAADVMEGCFGPTTKMRSAVSGFTPNIPWPEIGCPGIVDEDGQGTSAATPQIAAAAALWIARHWDELERLDGWRRGEAVRQALFRSASLGSNLSPDGRLGWGAIRAAAMLAISPHDLGELVEEPRATASWAWVKLLTGRGTGFADAALRSAGDLLGLELMQLAQRDPAVGRAVPDPDATGEKKQGRHRMLEAAEASPLASRALRSAAASALRKRAPRVPPVAPPAPPSATAGPPNPVRAPQRRRLNIYALDPSLGGALNSYEDQIATISVRNEELQPGPVGEYVEVVDVDPASNRLYPPVDLENVNLLKQDGATPSEGDPSFHQQMVYAVAMRTIENFELALGRRMLWASRWSGRPGDGNEYIPRLRIYPHALRQENAYYSPDRKALLFGYFPANSKVSDLTPPGTMVFSCLSADIIAHETTHALLDGQARSYAEPSNRDVRAFHEAFSDISALFQQYTYRDLVRRQIARHRGALSAASLLGGLARQFGEGTGRSGPLRRYPDIDPGISYEDTLDTHRRGSLLTAAVYRAFLAIFDRRTSDLIRLATSGTGILPEGALHPDLVDRLTDEATRAARHVLTMCIRALDYTPPVDITFGEYLRAIITADMEEFPTDDLGYRVAFLEAFRALQLLPRSLRTVSADTLRWQEPDEPRPAWLASAVSDLRIDFAANLSRREIFEHGETRSRALRSAILRGLQSQTDCDPLGLQHRLSYFASLASKGKAMSTTFMVENVRISLRVRPGGELAAQLVAVVRQRRPEKLFEEAADEDAERFWFRGGATLVVDLLGPGGPSVRYAIRKPIVSPSRLARERAFRCGDEERSPRATYFGSAGSKGFMTREPFALLHAERDGE